MTRPLEIKVSLDIQESEVSDEGLASVVRRSVLSSLQQVGNLGLVQADVTVEVVDGADDS